MSFLFGFIGIIFVIAIVFMMLMYALLQYMRYKVKRGVNKVFGRYDSSQKKSRWGGGTRTNTQTTVRRKKIDKDVGEYVEFEEITVFHTGSAQQAPPADFKVESQIEDVEWEEIKEK